MTFIYPDLYTALEGAFDSTGMLVKGRQVMLAEVNTAQNGGHHQQWLPVAEVRFSDAFGTVLSSDVSTSDHLSNYPQRRDPYELKTVEVAKSTVPGAGEGVFLKKSVPALTVISYFNGVRYPAETVPSWIPFNKPSVYLVETVDYSGKDINIDIPPQFAKWNNYFATSGHKV